MCGIAGTFGFSDLDTTKRMCKKIRYRGPDEIGFYSDNEVSLGNVRLKIIDLETGKQPMANEDGTVIVVFNGEIYNFRELREGLEKKHRFKSNSDTEVIVHLYEEMGSKFVEKLDGPFAIALWDSDRKIMLLARDRLGIKPLYYFGNGDELVFASEIKNAHDLQICTGGTYSYQRRKQTAPRLHTGLWKETKKLLETGSKINSDERSRDNAENRRRLEKVD
jgi:asparagine synthase (glutamine-hydrolysing)